MELDEIQWQQQASQAAWVLVSKCAGLHKSNPNEPVLGFFINTLMTELWDIGFSQSEIRKAFEDAIADMPRYSAGQEQRGQ
jgi:hypothetical protein